ncbi:YceI family protein [Dokdonia sp.]|uniref:YceI family protein n=1 Tax=Dokdonia sp. TaxID=2024995 RepID=UPI003264EFE5
MKIKLTFIFLFLLVASEVAAQNYTIDSEHSSVQIQIQRFGVIDVVGRFKDVEGTITYSKDDITKSVANAAIKVASYDANSAGGEAAVKSNVFLDAETYPEITFTTTSVVQENDKNYLIGNVTIHGVTNEIKLPFTIHGPLLDLPTKKQSIAFVATITINRQDYGIAFNAKLASGTSIIGNDVKITLNILALEE